MAQGATMANYHAVYHPSDENYLAIAGGDTYATGATYCPNIKDPGTAISGDELEAPARAGRPTSRAWARRATPRTQYDSYYEPDDAPFFNYTDVSGNAGPVQRRTCSTPAS